MPILRPLIVANTIAHGRVNRLEKLLAERLERAHRRVVHDLARLRVPRRPRAHLRVRGVLQRALRVADARGDHARHPHEVELRAPEAAAGERGEGRAARALRDDAAGEGVLRRLPAVRLGEASQRAVVERRALH
eukprot:CAMPEP_0113270008 /NCGR_PEP_ID=MMETSP0008_2-20120614/22014_1 /TAXON_ID=97485 /ORGANISM="Prymnesium parvum" /LENGTH=133 /DNA_ID=CAMNT_0000119281 /DNA_START=282 /DNA_END=683 /DNA_ORIENTATION=+ /assembly_acc=CAM_ASM_000153